MSDLVAYEGDQHLDRRPTPPPGERSVGYAWQVPDLGVGGPGRRHVSLRAVLGRPAAVQAEVVLANVALLIGCSFAILGIGGKMLLLIVALINGCFVLGVVNADARREGQMGTHPRRLSVAILASIGSVVIEGIVLYLAVEKATTAALALLAAMPLLSLALAVVGTNRALAQQTDASQLPGPGGRSSATYHIGQ